MENWDRFRRNFYYSPAARLMLDWGGMGLTEEYLASMAGRTSAAFDAMEALERGEIANPSEERMVGHYWLRAPELAPTPELRGEIENCRGEIRTLTEEIRTGALRSEKGELFRNVIVAGIGGSSLGPVFVSDALSGALHGLKLFFLDNTDPDGMDAIFSAVEPELDATLTVVISKSGGTVETRNGMEEARAFYESRGLSFPRHALCVSGRGSKLDLAAEREGWLRRFPLWDWVGGRTSVMSAVGLLPLSLAGVDVDEFLRGAAECDRLTRVRSVRDNPAALMALSWYLCSGGRGGETMVVLPYKDSLKMFVKYLQQLTMESLGKELDLDGRTVNQGLAVMGNKGSSDQHSYVQQLVAGPENIFVTFVEVLRDRKGPSPTVGEDSTSGDYLHAFLLGTKKTLEAHGKRTLLLSIPQVDAYHVGQLIALFERAVGLYASFIHINAYDQPAVELGKKAACGLIELKNSVRTALEAEHGQYRTAEELAAALHTGPEDVFRLLVHLSQNDPHVRIREASPIWESTFAAV